MLALLFVCAIKRMGVCVCAVEIGVQLCSSCAAFHGDLSLDGEGMYSEDGSISGMLSEDWCRVEGEGVVIEVLIQN